MRTQTCIITDAMTAGQVLASRPVDRLLSIVDPGQAHPIHTGLPDEHELCLQFDDQFTFREGTPAPCTEEHIYKIMAFADTFFGGSFCLAHCHAGVSRSTAAFYIMLAYASGPSHSESAFKRTLELRPFARPNRRMIELAQYEMDRWDLIGPLDSYEIDLEKVAA